MILASGKHLTPTATHSMETIPKQLYFTKDFISESKMASYTLFPENLSLTSHELDTLYGLVRHESNRLQKDPNNSCYEIGSYVHTIEILNKKLTNSYLQRKQFS